MPTSSFSFNASTDLAWGDVAVQIHLKMSKRDHFGNRTDVIVGVTGMDIALSCCWLSTSVSRPLFPECNRHNTDRASVCAPNLGVLLLLGIPSHKYAGHSFCIGATATEAMMVSRTH